MLNNSLVWLLIHYNLISGAFFIVAGEGHVFCRYCGTVVLIVLLAITRMLDNPITGRAGPIMPMAIYN